MRFLKAGKNREGYWDYEKFEAQAIDVLDCLEVILPENTQVVLEVDHSSGHAKFRDDGLHVPSMNLKWGGKQKKMRDSLITAGCLGQGEAKMHFDGNTWGTDFAPDDIKETVDKKATVDMMQTFSFAANDPPPFYDCGAPKFKVQRKRKRKDANTSEGSVSGKGSGGLSQSERKTRRKDDKKSERSCLLYTSPSPRD